MGWRRGDLGGRIECRRGQLVLRCCGWPRSTEAGSMHHVLGTSCVIHYVGHEHGVLSPAGVKRHSGQEHGVLLNRWVREQTELGSAVRWSCREEENSRDRQL